MDKILDFDPRSDFQIRMEHEKLRMASSSLWDLFYIEAYGSGFEEMTSQINSTR